MNVAITRAAEGLPRRAFTVDDISRMIEAGVLGADENFELIEGALVMMAAKHVGHDKIKHVLTKAPSRAAPDELYVGIEATLQLAKDMSAAPMTRSPRRRRRDFRSASAISRDTATPPPRGRGPAGG